MKLFFKFFFISGVISLSLPWIVENLEMKLGHGLGYEGLYSFPLFILFIIFTSISYSSLIMGKKQKGDWMFYWIGVLGVFMLSYLLIKVTSFIIDLF